MAQAKYIDAQDGYKARVAPIWTEEKLGILAGYLPAFAKATTKAPGWYALDCFAGGGLNYSETRKIEIPASPLIALEAGPPEADEVVMAEEDKRAFEALEHRTAKYGARAQTFNDDCNKVIDQMLARVPKRAPAFAFLDPEGSELEWETVEAIADHKRGHAQTKIEQLILFSEPGMVRLMRDHPDYVTSVFGHDRWKPIRERRKKGEITADEARTAYVNLYGRGLEDLDYKIVLDREIKKQGGNPMYFLIFASDHPAGKKIMGDRFDSVIKKVQEELGQGTLFTPPSAARKTRLGQS